MPIGVASSFYSADSKLMVIEERLLNCADLPVVGGQAPQPRLAASTDKSLLHDVNERQRMQGHAKLSDRSPGRIPVSVMELVEMVEPDGIEPTTSSLQS